MQPIPGKMRHEMVIEIQSGMLNGQNSRFFSNEPFEKRSVMRIQDSNLYSYDPFRVSSVRERAQAV